MTFEPPLLALAAEVLGLCRTKGLRLATAESCTGGLLAGALTAIAGSSDVVEAGFVTYSNEAKSALLGVPASVIRERGAVSAECARAMAEGALARAPADLAAAVTGIAGPGGGTAAKPVGLVHVAVARQGFPLLERRLTLGDVGRERVRLLSVEAALELLRDQAAALP